jgi:hypothetical protein
MKRNLDVFVNCPFDQRYKPLFNAIVFAVKGLGFAVRCALEASDAGEFRLEKINRIIEQCQFGIHDISSVAIDRATGLPRFNMPFELGLFLGCKRFGGKPQRPKVCLVLDRKPFRYRNSLSDIAGQDVQAHHGDPERAVRHVRDWLVQASRRKRLPGGQDLVRRRREFLRDLPSLCRQLHRNAKQLTFLDMSEMIEIWLEANR